MLAARPPGQPLAWSGAPQDGRGLAWAALAPAAAATVATISDRRVQVPSALVPDQPSLYRLCRQWVQNEPELALMPEVRRGWWLFYPELAVGLCRGTASPMVRQHEGWGPHAGCCGSCAGRYVRWERLFNRAAQSRWLGEPHPSPTPARLQAAVPSQLPPLPPRAEEDEAVLAQPPPAEDPLLCTAQEPPIDLLQEHHCQHWKAARAHMQRQEAARSARYAARLQGLLPAAPALGVQLPLLQQQQVQQAVQQQQVQQQQQQQQVEAAAPMGVSPGAAGAELATPLPAAAQVAQ